MSAGQGKKINVAVIGGGMGGLCVAIGLLKHPHIQVNIYEAAHKFAEIGAGVAFGPNAQRAMGLISVETEQAYLRQVTRHLSKASAKTWFEFRYGTPDKDGELVVAPHNETGQSTLHRAKFLDELVALIPDNAKHFGRRLDRLEDHGLGKGVQMFFKDGTCVVADCVIGADGIHSAVRRHLLGADHPALNAEFTGAVAYRGIIPMKQAIEALGEHYAQTSTIFMGHGGNVTLYPIDHGEQMNIVAVNSDYKEWTGPWVQQLSSERLHQDFEGWGPTVEKIVQLLDTPATQAWSIWDLPAAPTFWHGNVVMMGDAAHASTPFQGQGAGQAIEDAYVLESLFEFVDDIAKIPHAFKAFDVVRRPRSQHVVTTSRESNEIVSLRQPGIGEDAAALKENISWRMDWMWHRDVKGERDEALSAFHDLNDGREVE